MSHYWENNRFLVKKGIVSRAGGWKPRPKLAERTERGTLALDDVTEVLHQPWTLSLGSRNSSRSPVILGDILGCRVRVPVFPRVEGGVLRGGNDVSRASLRCPARAQLTRYRPVVPFYRPGSGPRRRTQWFWAFRLVSAGAHIQVYGTGSSAVLLPREAWLQPGGRGEPHSSREGVPLGSAGGSAEKHRLALEPGDHVCVRVHCPLQSLTSSSCSQLHSAFGSNSSLLVIVPTPTPISRAMRVRCRKSGRWKETPNPPESRS